MNEICKKQQDDSKIKIQNIDTQNKITKNKTREIHPNQQFNIISQPQKKKIQEISSTVYLTCIADQRQRPHQDINKKDENKDKQRRQITQNHEKKNKYLQKESKLVANQSKTIINTEEKQIKMQDQQSNSHQTQKQQQKGEIQNTDQSQNLNDYNSLNDEIINECLIWKCPCGVDMFGPIQYFNHIQVDHKNEPLQRIIYKKTLQKMFDNYPNFTLNELQIIEQAEDIQYQKQINKIYLKHQNYFKNNDISILDTLRNRGTYSDMCYTFIENLNIKSDQQKMIRQFFHYLKFYIDQNINKKQWHQQSPNEILKYGNDIITFFFKHKLRFQPFEEEDIRELFYILSSWMFMNHWCNDRIFYEVNEDNLKQEEQDEDQQKKQQG